MDNPQPYQPLSQALQSLPSTTSRPHYTTTGHHAAYTQHEVTQSHPHPHPHAEEEEEDEEEEDEDEGVVEEQLNQAEAELRVSRPTSPKGPTSDPHSGNPLPTSQLPSILPISEKRKPGRPRGSKNRRPRASAKNESQFYAGHQGSSASATPAIAALPSHPNITPQNQPYYEFQWRMLNLCAEFYGAAEELVKATPPLVVAQSYQLGPGVKVDPLAMLGEAKRVCDTLLANPSHLVTNPPQPVYPVLPTVSVYPPVLQPPSTAILPSTAAAAPAAPITTSSTSGVPSFVVPLNQPYPQYPVYGSAPHAQYPTVPYYQYPTAYPYYPPPQPIGAPIANTSTSTGATATTSATIATTTTVNGTPWSEDESEQLRKLVEESKSRGGGQTAKVDWEWIVGEWGSSRSKSQILRQATALNLKEGPTRGTKRRREEGQPDVSGVSVAPSFQPSTSSTATTLTTGPTSAGNIPISSPDPSVSHSTSTTTPGASPALQSQQRPSSSAAVSAPLSAPTTSTVSVAAPNMPWPMPTVAVQSAVSVLSTTTPTSGTGPSTSSSLSGHGHDQRSSYYRPRPANSTDTTKVGHQQQQQPQNHHHQPAHHYLFASNGHGQPHGGMAYRQKENGK